MRTLSKVTDGYLPKVGDVFAQKYRIEQCVGRGGMSAVYCAYHEILNQPVAIKLLLPEIAASEASVARFINEARSSARIRSEHVTKVYDIDKLPSGNAYMVMEYLDGSDLDSLLLNQGPLEVEICVDYVLQALEAIAQAHALGIIHRDLKPANLFLANSPDGSSIIKVLDFGISKASTGPVSSLTATNTMLGSPSFMSPEQVRSSRSVDHRSDIWSLGVCLYQLLTRVMPFNGDNFGEVFASILETTPPPPSSIREDIPPEIDAIVAKCLERNRDQRYCNAAELAAALEHLANPSNQGFAKRIDRIIASEPILSPTSASANFGVHTPLPKNTSDHPSSPLTFRRSHSTPLPLQAQASAVTPIEIAASGKHLAKAYQTYPPGELERYAGSKTRGARRTLLIAATLLVATGSATYLAVHALRSSLPIPNISEPKPTITPPVNAIAIPGSFDQSKEQPPASTVTRENLLPITPTNTTPPPVLHTDKYSSKQPPKLNTRPPPPSISSLATKPRKRLLESKPPIKTEVSQPEVVVEKEPLPSLEPPKAIIEPTEPDPEPIDPLDARK